MFEAEAEGLQAIQASRALRVPTPVCWGVRQDSAYLVLEYIELANAAGAKIHAELGRGLAQLHRTTADRFGWCRDNTIGSTAQVNTWVDGWAEFFAEYKFLVGISIDGPTEWHDHFRRDHAGNATSHRVWAGLDLLKKHNVEFNVLVTLNAYNAPHAGDIYRYFVNRGIYWMQFIPILELDDQGKPQPYSCSPEQFGQFMMDVFDLWRDRHVGIVSERLIDSLLHTIVHGQAALCCNAERCANAQVLEWNGDLYACDHYVYKEWLLGNIMETPLEELATSARLDEFAKLKTDLPDACRDCEFLPYCNAGCPKHHLPPAAGGDPKRVNHFCEGYKRFFREALPELQRIAHALKQGRPPTPAAAPAKPAGPTGPVSRNAPCPCGSGRKYKQCCGKK